MNEIFINYRTGDEMGYARLIDRELSHRFGSDAIFRASKSIPPGADYKAALLTAVRNSEVLLAIIGPRWLTTVDEQGRNRLHDEADWTRREILEAFEYGVPVVPILIDGTPLLRPSDLPPELARLANCEYRRLDHRGSGDDLRVLGDELAKLAPSLVDLDQTEKATEPDVDGRGAVTLHAGDHALQQSGGTNTVVNNARGPVNTGTGHQFTGDGVSYVAGDNRGEMH